MLQRKAFRIFFAVAQTAEFFACAKFGIFPQNLSKAFAETEMVFSSDVVKRAFCLLLG